MLYSYEEDKTGYIYSTYPFGKKSPGGGEGVSGKNQEKGEGPFE